MSETADLILTRTLRAPRAALWRCWTERDLLIQWFCPAPWRVAEARIDLRPGGAFDTDMRGPGEGEAHATRGCFLVVEPQSRLVFTDCLTAGFQPAANPFMTAEVLFEDAPGGGTHYIARAQHKDAATRDQHAAMGFEPGWGAAADQLDALALSL